MKGRAATTAIAAALIFFAGYAALFIAPDEATMHEIQRVFYFHLGMLDGDVHGAFDSPSSPTSRGSSLASLNGTGWASRPVEVGVVSCTAGLDHGRALGQARRGAFGGPGTRA